MNTHPTLHTHRQGGLALGMVVVIVGLLVAITAAAGFGKLNATPSPGILAGHIDGAALQHQAKQLRDGLFTLQSSATIDWTQMGVLDGHLVLTDGAGLHQDTVRLPQALLGRDDVPVRWSFAAFATGFQTPTVYAWTTANISAETCRALSFAQSKAIAGFIHSTGMPSLTDLGSLPADAAGGVQQVYSMTNGVHLALRADLGQYQIGCAPADGTAFAPEGGAGYRVVVQLNNYEE